MPRRPLSIRLQPRGRRKAPGKRQDPQVEQGQADPGDRFGDHAARAFALGLADRVEDLADQHPQRPQLAVDRHDERQG